MPPQTLQNRRICHRFSTGPAEGVVIRKDKRTGLYITKYSTHRRGRRYNCRDCVERVTTTHAFVAEYFWHELNLCDYGTIWVCQNAHKRQKRREHGLVKDPSA